MSLLDVRFAVKQFGGVHAIRRVNLSIDKGQIVGLIGPNGAGKTSVFNCITGLIRLDDGEILFGDEKTGLHRLAPHLILQRGVARTFQNLRIFKHMTSLENVAVGFHSRTKSNLWDALMRTKRFRADEKMILRESSIFLKFVGLESKEQELAGNLSYGQQKRLEIARALASSPRLLLLDEPVAGMNPTEKEEIVCLIRKVREGGISILIIEHDMKVVMPLSDKVVVMDEGKKISEGSPDEVRRDPRVIRAYLGEG